MNRTLVAALGLALIAAPAVSSAAESDSGFFAAVHGGISSNEIKVPDEGLTTDRRDSAYAVRAGYRWGGALNYGVEAGFADLGSSSVSAADNAGTLGWKAHGVTVGGNLQYDFGGSNWFAGIRGGWFRADNELTASLGGASRRLGTHNNEGWYAGAGVGYKITENLRAGLAYDNYDNRLKIEEAGVKQNFNTEMYSAFFEYKF